MLPAGAMRRSRGRLRELLDRQTGSLSLDLGPGWNDVRVPLLVLLVVAVANVAVLFSITLPTWRETAAAGTAIRRGEQAQAIVLPLLDRARLQYGRVLEAEVALDDLRSRIGLRTGSVSDVVSTLQAAVDAAQLEALRIGYGEQPIPELGLTQLQIDLPVRGNYGQLRRFLDELLAGPMFVVLERVGASTPSQGDSSGELLVSVTASVLLDDSVAGGFEVAQPDATPAPTPAADDPVGVADSLAERLRQLPAIPLPPESFALRLARLDQELAEHTPTKRNLFAFAGPPPGSSSGELPEEIVDEVDDFVAEPVMPYELIGVTRTREGLLATVSDGDHVHVVGHGDVLPDGYRITRIDTVSVDLEAGVSSVTLSLRKRDQLERNQ